MSISILSAKKIAFLIDTGTAYQLKGDKDIETMKRLLGDRYEYIILSGEKATTQNIIDRFNSLANMNLTKEDIVVIYYTGHGDRFVNGGQEESDKRDDFLVPADIKLSPRNKENEYDVTNAIIDDQLKYLYAKIGARKIIIVDACHSESTNKSVSLNSHYRAKTYKPENSYYRAFKIDNRWRESRNRNFLHFGASQENESALDSPQGGKFTLAIRDVLREYKNISFAKLERLVQERLEGKFKPSIANDSTIDKNTLYTKDIFATATSHQSNSLKSLLDSKSQTIDVMTQSSGRRFSVGDKIDIKGYITNKPKHLYLIELKGENDYKLISSSNSCIDYEEKGKHMCQFINLKATKPLGSSSIYMIGRDSPLNIDNIDKDSIINQDYFEDENYLLEDLKGKAFEVGKIEIETD